MRPWRPVIVVFGCLLASLHLVAQPEGPNYRAMNKQFMT